MLALDPLPLPDGIVGILDLQLRQRIGFAAQKSTVQRAQFVDQHPHRPAVGDDVMHGDQQRMLVFGKTDAAGRGSADRASRSKATPASCAISLIQLRLGVAVLPQIVLEQNETGCSPQEQSAAPALRRRRRSVVRSASCRATIRSRARASALRSRSPFRRSPNGM